MPFEEESAEQEEEMAPLMREYLEHIEKLCRQEDIHLVLVKTPTISHNAQRSLAIQNFADGHGLHFLDFNEKKLYQKTGLDFKTDNYDVGHGNLWGAQKVTTQIGQALAEWYGMGGHTDSQWEKTKEYYEGIEKDCELIHMTDIEEYTAAIRDERYSVFISAKDEWTAGLKDSVIENLKRIGLAVPLQEESGCSYLALVSGGNVVEQIGNEVLHDDGTIGKWHVMYEMLSAGNGCGNRSSIKINGNEYSKDCRGLNIVVYNHDTKKIVDSVCFDTYEEGSPAIR